MGPADTRSWAAAVGIALVLGVAAAGCGSPAKPLRTSTQQEISGPVVIDYSVNEVFQPSSAPGNRSLSARAAFDMYNRRSGPLPTGVRALFGHLTQPTTGRGRVPVHYLLKNQPVWGYRDAGGCETGYGPTPIPRPADDICISWTFLDPWTAAEIDATQQTYQTSSGLPGR